jgi:hypothetical protein
MKSQTPEAFDSSSVAMRLGMCAAALAGIVAPVADANAVVVTTVASIPVPANIDGVYINFLTGATGTSAAAVPGWDFDPYATGTSLSFFWPTLTAPANTFGGAAASATGPYLALAAGATISSASTFVALTASANTVAFQTTGPHILGFRFYNEATSATNYGYVTIMNTAPSGFPATITGWSYENSGGAITIPSAVPEVSSAAMLSLGALALGALNLRKLRRQRRQLAA